MIEACKVVLKRCCTCKKYKSTDQFGKHRQQKDGLNLRCLLCSREQQNKWLKNNPEAYSRYKKRARLFVYKITLEQKEDFFSRPCAIDGCDRMANSIDHDHSCCSGRVTCGNCIRGAICKQCNSALGLVKDNKTVLLGMVEYLNKWEEHVN